MNSVSKTRLLRTQRGAGLIEVMVSLMLLAIGILGYIALQSTAIKSTNDSLVLTNSMTIMRDLADQIRFNSDSLGVYATEINDLNASFDSNGSATKPQDCSAQTCDPDQQAAHDSYSAVLTAYESGAQLGMVVCPGTQGNNIMETQCLITSWGDTDPTVGSDSDPSDGSMSCIDQATGNYMRQSDCVILEVQ